MKKIAIVAHHLKEYQCNTVSVVEKIFLNEKVLIFVLLAEQLVYIKRRKNMQYFIKSKGKKKKSAEAPQASTDKEKYLN